MDLGGEGDEEEEGLERREEGRKGKADTPAHTRESTLHSQNPKIARFLLFLINSREHCSKGRVNSALGSKGDGGGGRGTKKMEVSSAFDRRRDGGRREGRRRCSISKSALFRWLFVLFNKGWMAPLSLPPFPPSPSPLSPFST